MQNVSEGITTETAEIYKLQKSIMNNYTLIFLKLRKSVTFLEKYKKQYYNSLTHFFDIAQLNTVQ